MMYVKRSRGKPTSSAAKDSDGNDSDDDNNDRDEPPMVLSMSGLNSSFTKRFTRQLFPTPEFPNSTTLKWYVARAAAIYSIGTFFGWCEAREGQTVLSSAGDGSWKCSEHASKASFAQGAPQELMLQARRTIIQQL
jgi:hypothetical protein